MDTSIRKLKQFILNWKISLYLACFSSKRNTRLHEKIRFNHKQYYLYCNIISHFYYYYHRLYVLKLAFSKNYKARVIVSTLTVGAFTVKTEFQDNQLIKDIAGCIFDLNNTKNLNFFQILRFLLLLSLLLLLRRLEVKKTGMKFPFTDSKWLWNGNKKVACNLVRTLLFTNWIRENRLTNR